MSRDFLSRHCPSIYLRFAPFHPPKTWNYREDTKILLKNVFSINAEVRSLMSLLMDNKNSKLFRVSSFRWETELFQRITEAKYSGLLTLYFSIS